MRLSRLSALSAVVLVTALTPALAAHHRAPAPAPTPTATTRYVPPAEPGDIFVVIDFTRVHGTPQPIDVTAILGNRRRDLVVATPYQNCIETTPAGIVLRVRHFTADTTPLTLTTTGTIIRGPYQGEMPLEVLHPCYQLVS
jgi:hypothetical protein